eukprot:scaffold1954_cov113-Isochrysis_galbana.AAC.3
MAVRHNNMQHARARTCTHSTRTAHSYYFIHNSPHSPADAVWHVVASSGRTNHSPCTHGHTHMT